MWFIIEALSRRIRNDSGSNLGKRKTHRLLRVEPLHTRICLAVIVMDPDLSAAEVRQLVERSEDGDSLLFEAGVHDVADLTISGEKHVYGIPGKTILEADSGVTLTLREFDGYVFGITFQGGDGDIGGNIVVESSDVYFDQVEVLGGYATIAAAGLAARNSRVVIADSLFANNRQGRSECQSCFNGTVAAIGAFDNSDLEVRRTEVRENVSWWAGSVGGHRITAGSRVFAEPPRRVVVSDSEFSNNRADSDNGVYVIGADQVSVTNATFHTGHKGIRRSAAVSVQATQNVGIVNNTFDQVDHAVFLSADITDASVRNNIFHASGTAVEAGQAVLGGYNLFYEVTVELTGGIQDHPDNKRADPLFVDPTEGEYRLQPDSPAVSGGDPAAEFLNWDGSTNDMGAFGGTPARILAPSDISVSEETLTAKSYVLSRAEHRPQLEPIPVDTLDRLDFSQVSKISTSAFTDDEGFYWTARPRASNDVHEQLIYREAEGGKFRRVRFDDITVDYNGVVDGNSLPPAGRVLSRVNYGVPHPIDLGDFPVVFTAGGAAFYGRLNGMSELSSETGTSHRMMGAHNVFPTAGGDEDFPFAREVYASIGDDGSGRLLVLFDSEVFAGVMRLEILGGAVTVMETRATTFLRQELNISEEPWSGLSAQSSMNLKALDFSANDNARDVEVVKGWFDDGTPVVHVVDNSGAAGTFHREDLTPSTGPRLTRYALLNVDRNPDHFSFFHPRDVYYEQRPSVIVEIIDSSVPLGLKTVTQVTDGETDDNHVTIASPQVDLFPAASFSDGIRLGTRHIVGAVEADANNPPALEAPESIIAHPGELVELVLRAGDVDQAAGLPEEVAFRAVSGLQAGMALDQETGRFQWTPSEADIGVHSVTVEAVDSYGDTSERRTLTLNISEAVRLRVSGIDAGPLLYRQDSTPLPLAPAAVLTAASATEFAGSQLKVEPLTTPQVGDRWLLRETADVTLDDAAVMFQGAPVGSHSGGSDGTPLTVGFNSAATLAAVQGILRAVAFLHEGQAPDAVLQEAEITIGGGVLAPSDPVQVSVSKWDRPDRPLFENLGGKVHYVEDHSPLTLVDAAALISDPDQHPDFGGSKLTARMSRNADSFDRLTIASTGDAPGEVRLDGTSVLVGGTVVGELTQHGVGTSPLQVVFNSAAAEESLTAVLQAMQYQSTHQNLRVASKDVRFDLVDPDGISAFPVYKLVTLETANDPAVLAGIDGTSVTYNENALPRTVASGTTLSDPDYNGGGSLTVAISASADSGDRLRVLHQGMGTNQVGVESNRVYFSGEQVGTISGGVGTNPLVVTFNSRATVPSAQSIARVVQFWSTSEDPSEVARTLAYTFNDGAGATTPAQTATVVVNAINDAPVVANLGDDLSTTSGGSAIQVSTSVTISDVDSPDFDGGLFRVRIASGATTEDLLSIRHVGTGADQIAVSGNEVYWSGTLIGTFTGGSGGSILQVSLNADATPLAVQRLARNILFSTTGVAGDRQVEFQVWDGDGANTAWTGKTIAVSPSPTSLSSPLLESTTDDEEEELTFAAYAESVDGVLVDWQL